MKHDNTTFRDGIETSLRAMSLMLERALTEVNASHAAIRRDEQNLAVGTVLAVENHLERSLVLYRAILALHRYRP